ncbi:MAG: isochorismatase family cysteine hydrolase [Anaerolineaceae bacterium]|nr:isochorismatase family cysteine hydrolase [Anaerolineaceae bacterium]
MKPIQEQANLFLPWLEGWLAERPELILSEAAADPDEIAIFSVDVIKGFCNMGPLSSPRVADIVTPVVSLMQTAWDEGVRHIVLTQDSHEPDAVEFGGFPPHCIRGTEEAETVDAIAALPFFDQLTIIEKNSIDSGLNTGLDAWLAERPQIQTCIVVGDCTDLCVYQLAMHLRLDANARQLQRRVIVPVNAVDTYDTPMAVAEELGIYPHPGDLLHATFLYHMAVNGIEVVKSIE